MNDLKIIQKFCNDHNPQNLENLSKENFEFLINKCREAVYYYKNSKKSLAKLVLHYFNDCITRSKVDLRPLQLKVAEYFQKNDELLLKWGTGCGKTICALVVSQCYLDQFPDGKVVVISPLSVINNFPKEMKKYGWKLEDNRYEFYTFDTVLNLEKKGNPVDCENALLIIDEVHNLRNYKQPKKSDFSRYLAAIHCAMKSRKRLLLSATPFVNNTSDFISIINLLYGDINKVGINDPNTEYKLRNTIAKSKFYQQQLAYNFTIISELLKGKISYADKCNNPDFPNFTIHEVLVNMTPKYYHKYLAAIKTSSLFMKPAVFLNGYRRAVNTVGNGYVSLKINEALKYLHNTQSIIYTNWLEFGINVLTDKLTENNINYAIISGKTSIKNRNSIVSQYNEGKINCLIITKAGSEGIDLKGVRVVIILEPVWNPAGMDQIIGRAVRFKSHEHLPKDQRHVDIYLFNLVEPNINKDNVDISISGDILLYRIIKEKQHTEEEINKLMKDISI